MWTQRSSAWPLPVASYTEAGLIFKCVWELVEQLRPVVVATFFRIKTGVVGVDTSTGKHLWQIPWLGGHGAPTATPVVEGDKMFITTRGTTGGQCAMLQLTDGAAKIVWQSEDLDCHVASAVIWQGYIYGIQGTLNGRNADLRCLDLAAGAVKWSQKGMGTGALILADGKLIVLGDRGDLLVAQAAPEGFQQLAKAHVIDGHCWVQPVLSHGRLFCRSNQGDLVCLR